VLVLAGPHYLTLVTVEVDASGTWTPAGRKFRHQGQGHLAVGHVVVELGLPAAVINIV
jgi:hypothetical protein